MGKYKEAIRASRMNYQLVHTNDHCHNITEKAIQFWKEYFISVLSGTTKSFLLHLWCQVIPQAEIQILILRQSNGNKNIYCPMLTSTNSMTMPPSPSSPSAWKHSFMKNQPAEELG